MSKKTATCSTCDEEKHSWFTNGMCSACYKKSRHVEAVCENCEETKRGEFRRGLCSACYQKGRHVEAVCNGCGETKHCGFTNGTCSACYQRRPRRRETRNAWERRRVKGDEGYRLARRIARGIWGGLAGEKNARTLDLLGCTSEQLVAHFRFTKHEGCGENPHIGHILVPSSWAIKYAGDEGVILCYQLPNLAYQNPDENLRLKDSPWYDCPYITDATIEVAKRFLAIAGTGEPELAELSAFIEVYDLTFGAQ